MFRNIDIKIIIIKDGKTTPRVAAIEPNIFPTLYPIKVDEFIAIGPGVDSETAIMFWLLEQGVKTHESY